MYKVFIADDEEFIIKSLMKGIHWDRYGFEVVASAIDGVDAFEAIKNIRPNLVLTDIRMPGMSGLELIKNIQEVDKSILFAVLSGYAEFAYAQKAIDYGAIGYCLKPFDDDVIYGILKKAKNILDEAGGNECDVLRLIQEDTAESRSRLEDLLETHGIPVKAGIAVAASFGRLTGRFDNNLKYLRMDADVGRNLYILSDADVDRFIESELPEEVEGVGICRNIYTTENLRHCVKQASALAYQFFVTGRRGFFLAAEPKNEDIQCRIENYEKAVAQMDIGQVRETLDAIGESAKNGALTIKHIVNIYNTYVKYLSRVFHEDSYEKYVYSFEDLCYLFKDANAMIDHIKTKIASYVGMKSNTPCGNIKNEYLKKIVVYINQNFYKEISIQSLSQEFSMNPNYVSQLFTKEVGMTFTAYLTNLRIDYAKRLLLKTEYPLSEIVNKCGYTDYFYFIRVFKKMTGLTPSHFRKDDRNNQ
jgi:Response regulator containing CheY-like receiver domain and AraC-type DNA-binding domain